MKNRLAQIVLNKKILEEGLDTDTFADMLYSLPSDTKLINIFDQARTPTGYDSENIYIRVCSSEFKEVPEAALIPEIIAHFKRDEAGDHFDYLDDSAAREKIKKDPTKWLSASDLIEMELNRIHTVRLKHFIEGPSPEPIYMSQLCSPESFPGDCNHSWKHYQGLIEQYEFCEKCQEKK